MLILEYAPGVELFDAILSKASFSEDEARPVFVQASQLFMRGWLLFLSSHFKLLRPLSCTSTFRTVRADFLGHNSRTVSSVC